MFQSSFRRLELNCHEPEEITMWLLFLVTLCVLSCEGWDDIGYNFLIGGDGRVYEARGWDRVGAHTRGWNDVAVAFSVMGDYTNKLPNSAALTAVHNIIDCGILKGKITPDYKMYGHRNAGTTECPGQQLYDLIRRWPHFDPNKPVRPTPAS
uniref:Peptidoglycan recognition protein 1a n=1 Tax=Sinohyriopsis cumingii TaxID=165450 RepID=A0A023I761_SINCU|nr:peptidoglycan recognition protein 1a [Sinohyriopsis cumingii]